MASAPPRWSRSWSRSPTGWCRFVRATGLAGSAARPLGRALATAGRWSEAIAALEEAIAADRSRGGIPFAARAQRDLAEVLLARGAPRRRRRGERADCSIAERPAARARRYGRASSTRLKGVSAARRIELKPACSRTVRRAASPAWAPSAGVCPSESAMACGTQISAEPA